MESVLPLSGTAAKPWDGYNPDWVSSLHLGHSKKISGGKLETTLEAAAKRDGRARNFDQKRAEYERLQEEIKAKRQKIDDPGSEIQDIVFDCDVDETSEEEMGIAIQTGESEYLFVSEPEKPFDENWFRNDDKKVNLYTGLPGFDVVMSVFRHVSPHVNRKSMTLSTFHVCNGRTTCSFDCVARA